MKSEKQIDGGFKHTLTKEEVNILIGKVGEVKLMRLFGDQRIDPQLGATFIFNNESSGRGLTRFINQCAVQSGIKVETVNFS